MHFAKVSAALLGLAAFATAVPHQIEAGNVERRMTWKPRSLEQGNAYVEKRGQGRDKDSITIVDTTVVKLSEESRNSEIELTVLVEEKIKIISEKRSDRDNIRKNHYKNKDKSVNTVIIVITEVIDIRSSDDRNTRYLRHQVRADNGAKEEVIVQVTEVVAITIDSNDRDNHNKKKESHTVSSDESKGKGKGKGKSNIAATAASGAVANAIQTVDPNAPYAQSNQTSLLPSGAPAPSGQTVNFDPAAILEDNANGLFVQSV